MGVPAETRRALHVETQNVLLSTSSFQLILTLWCYTKKGESMICDVMHVIAGIELR